MIRPWTEIKTGKQVLSTQGNLLCRRFSSPWEKGSQDQNKARVQKVSLSWPHVDPESEENCRVGRTQPEQGPINAAADLQLS